MALTRLPDPTAPITLDVGLGVTVELPTIWTPLDRFKVPLVNAWAARQARIVAHREKVAAGAAEDARILFLWRRSWWELLFELWHADGIELVRRDLLGGELSVLNFPTSERTSQLFAPASPYGRFQYLPDSLTFFDLHARAKAGGSSMLRPTIKTAQQQPATVPRERGARIRFLDAWLDRLWRASQRRSPICRVPTCGPRGERN